MYQIYGVPTQNTLKTIYVAAELGIDYRFTPIDLTKGDHKQPSFIKINPYGKVPALQHDDFCMAESSAICRYLANANPGAMYPSEAKARAKVDQWLDFF